MATHVGKEGTVQLGATSVAEVNGWELEQSAELVEDSELSDEWRTFKSGTDVVKEWSATVTCWWDETDTSGQTALSLASTATLNLYGEGTASTDVYYSGTGIVETIGIVVAKGAIVERTFGFKGSGACTESTVA